jgi:hypothetical protein
VLKAYFISVKLYYIRKRVADMQGLMQLGLLIYLWFSVQRNIPQLIDLVVL